MTGRRHNFTLSAGRGGRRAFTLLELVVVLALLAILAGMAAPSLRGFVAGRRASDAADQLVALTRWARTHAIAESATYRLNLNAREGTYWISVEDAAGARPLDRDLARVFRVPEGVRLECDLAAGTGPDAGVQIARFYPSGRTEAALIRFIDSSTVVEVACRSATESFRVVPVGGGQ